MPGADHMRVLLTGRGRELTRLRVGLAIYSNIEVVAEPSVSLVLARCDQLQCHCIVVLLSRSNRRDTKQLISKINTMPGGPAVVLLLRQPTQDLVKLAKEERREFAHGRRGLSDKGVEVVAKALSLPERGLPKLNLTAPPRVDFGESSVEVEVVDIELHGAIAEVPPNDLIAKGQHCALTVEPRGGDAMRLPGRISECDGQEGSTRFFVTFDPLAEQTLEELNRRIRDWRERAAAEKRAARPATEEPRTRSDDRDKVPFRATVRVNVQGEKRVHYYRLRDISRGGALLASNGEFDGPPVDSEIEMQVRWRGQRVDLLGKVMRATRDEGDKSLHELGVSFLDDCPNDGLDKLFDSIGK